MSNVAALLNNTQPQWGCFLRKIMIENELTGSDLDAAVAERQNVEFDEFGKPIWFIGDELSPYSPSSDWSIGGPIIHSEGIMFVSQGPGRIMAYLRSRGTSGIKGSGETHLVAAMRCYVASSPGRKTTSPITRGSTCK
jgi:hypothetical protein